MGAKIKLGKTHNIGAGIIAKPMTVEERMDLLDERLTSLTKAFNAVNSAIVKDSRQQEEYDKTGNHANKDGVPIGISLLGRSTRGGTHVLSVKHNGYYIGTTEYDSLSAAAEASSGVRRSGWTFWRMPDGRTVKEAYGKANG